MAFSHDGFAEPPGSKVFCLWIPFVGGLLLLFPAVPRNIRLVTVGDRKLDFGQIWWDFSWVPFPPQKNPFSQKSKTVPDVNSLWNTLSWNSGNLTLFVQRWRLSYSWNVRSTMASDSTEETNSCLSVSYLSKFWVNSGKTALSVFYLSKFLILVHIVLSYFDFGRQISSFCCLIEAWAEPHSEENTFISFHMVLSWHPLVWIPYPSAVADHSI